MRAEGRSEAPRALFWRVCGRAKPTQRPRSACPPAQAARPGPRQALGAGLGAGLPQGWAGRLHAARLAAQSRSLSLEARGAHSRSAEGARRGGSTGRRKLEALGGVEWAALGAAGAGGLLAGKRGLAERLIYRAACAGRLSCCASSHCCEWLAP